MTRVNLTPPEEISGKQVDWEPSEVEIQLSRERIALRLAESLARGR